METRSVRKETYNFMTLGTKLQVNQFEPDGRPLGVIHFVHGLTEYVDMYDDLGNWFASRGYVFVAQEIEGHGTSKVSNTSMHCYGWEYMIDDVLYVYDNTKYLYPSAPYIMIGFSLGSFLVRDFLAKFNDKKVDKAVLIGTGHIPVGILNCVLGIVAVDIKIHGETAKTNLVHNLSFCNYNKKFKPNKTMFDWIYTNPETAKEYENDTRRGGDLTCKFFMEFLRGMKKCAESKNITQLGKTCNRILLISGTEDPVGGTKGVESVRKLLEKYGNCRVSTVLYNNLRHGVLMEGLTIRDDILRWIK